MLNKDQIRYYAKTFVPLLLAFKQTKTLGVCAAVIEGATRVDWSDRRQQLGVVILTPIGLSVAYLRPHWLSLISPTAAVHKLWEKRTHYRELKAILSLLLLYGGHYRLRKLLIAVKTAQMGVLLHKSFSGDQDKKVAHRRRDLLLAVIKSYRVLHLL